jgi:hypothetical protein
MTKRVALPFLFPGLLFVSAFTHAGTTTWINKNLPSHLSRQEEYAVAFSSKDITLHIQNSLIKVDGQALLQVTGETGGHVIYFRSPQVGRFIFSTRQHPKYEFEEVQVIDNRKILFTAGGKQFEWIVSAPFVERGTVTRLWMMHDKHPEPLKEKGGGGLVGASSHYEQVLNMP